MNAGRRSTIHRLLLSLPLIALFTGGGVSLSIRGAVFQDSPTSEQIVRERIKRIVNPTIPVGDRLTDYSELSKLPTTDRDAALGEVVRAADESIASMAAATLIRDRFPAARDLILPRISKWVDRNQLVVLQAIQFAPEDQTLWEIPREVIRNTLSSARTGTQSPHPQSALDSAAVVLAASNDLPDRILIRNSLLSQPGSRGLWLATAKMGGLEPREVILAASTYKDRTLSVEVRVAAAAALAPGDASAAAFVAAEIESLIARFAGREMAEMLVAAQSDQNEKKNLYYLREHLPLLATLRFLRTPGAEDLTFRFIAVKNDQIRVALGLVACTRWPERWLTASHAAFTREEYENLLGFLTVLRPELTPVILEKVPKNALDEIVIRLGQAGVVGVFGLPAAALG